MKLENGMFGVTDILIIGFTDNMEKVFEVLHLCMKKQIEEDCQTVLSEFEERT